MPDFVEHPGHQGQAEDEQEHARPVHELARIAADVVPDEKPPVDGRHDPEDGGHDQG